MGNGNKITFTGGSVGGAGTELYSDDDTTVTIHIAEPIANLAGWDCCINRQSFAITVVKGSRYAK